MKILNKMEKSNMMERMLKKGDRLTAWYKDYDFSNLEEDTIQSAWLSRLSLSLNTVKESSADTIALPSQVTSKSCLWTNTP